MQTIHDDVTVKGELTADKLNVGDALVVVIEPLFNAIQGLTARLDSIVVQVADMQEQIDELRARCVELEGKEQAEGLQTQIDELRAQNAELVEKVNKTIIL